MKGYCCELGKIPISSERIEQGVIGFKKQFLVTSFSYTRQEKCLMSFIEFAK